MDSTDAIPNTAVSFPPALRTKIGNRETVMAEGRTVREIIQTLDHAFPGVRFHLCHETGELRPFVNIFLNRNNIRYLQGLDTPIPYGATLHILPSVAGG